MLIECKYCGKIKEKKRGKKCVDCHKKYMQEYYQQNKDIIEEKNRNYYKEYYIKNKELILEKNRKEYSENKEYHSNRKRKDREENPEKYRLRKNEYNDNNQHIVAWRNLLKHTINYYQNKKNDKTENLLGYDFNELKTHITSLFTPGMNWENYGEWHIDHIKPICTFSKETLPSVVNSLKNLRPLWATTREINGIIYEGNLNREKYPKGTKTNK